jgi:hypothetical protein
LPALEVVGAAALTHSPLAPVCCLLFVLVCKLLHKQVCVPWGDRQGIVQPAPSPACLFSCFSLQTMQKGVTWVAQAATQHLCDPRPSSSAADGWLGWRWWGWGLLGGGLFYRVGGRGGVQTQLPVMTGKTTRKLLLKP